MIGLAPVTDATDSTSAGRAGSFTRYPELCGQSLSVSGSKTRSIPVTWGDRRGIAMGHDDQPCLFACSTWSSSGSAAGWSCSAARRRPRTPSCWYCGTRSPCYAAPSRGAAGLGRPGSTGRADPAPAQNAACAPAGLARHRPAVAPPPGPEKVDLPERHGTTACQHRDHHAHRAARHREQQLGVQENPGRAAEARLPGRRVHDPPGPQGFADPSGAEAAHRYNVAAVPACPGCDDACR